MSNILTIVYRGEEIEKKYAMLLSYACKRVFKNLIDIQVGNYALLNDYDICVSTNSNNVFFSFSYNSTNYELKNTEPTLIIHCICAIPKVNLEIDEEGIEDFRNTLSLSSEINLNFPDGIEHLLFSEIEDVHDFYRSLELNFSDKLKNSFIIVYLDLKGQDTTHYFTPLNTLEIIAGETFKYFAI